MLLRERTADRARGGASDETGFAGPRILAIRPGSPINRVLQQRGNRAVVLRGDDQHPISLGEFAFETNNLLGQVPFKVLIEHRQIVDAEQTASNLSAPSLASARASLRLIESRRLLPTMIAMRGFAMHTVPSTESDNQCHIGRR